MKTGFKLARLIFALLAILLALGTPRSAWTQTGPVIRVVPDATNPCSGGQISVEVDNVTSLIAYDVYLNFTPGAIVVTNVENGGFLDPGLSVPMPIDNANGTLSYNNAHQNPSTPKSGNGSLILIHYNVAQSIQVVNLQIQAETDLVGGDYSAISYGIVNTGFSTPAHCQPQHQVFLPLIRR